MKNVLFVITIAFSGLLLSCNSESKAEKTPTTLTKEVDRPIVTKQHVIQVPLVKYESLLQRFQEAKDTLLVVNFWATWCKPCVQELPHFFEVYHAIKNNEKVKLVLVTLDTKDNLETGVIPFIEKNKYETEHYLLDDNGRMDEWILKINKSWEGEIPATSFYKNGEQVHFVAGQMSKADLEKAIADYK